MAVPKKRTGHSAQGKRRANWKAVKPETTVCKNCGATVLTHTVCTACGYYKGKPVSKKVAMPAANTKPVKEETKTEEVKEESVNEEKKSAKTTKKATASKTSKTSKSEVKADKTEKVKKEKKSEE